MKVSLIEPRAPFFNFYSTVIKDLPLLGLVYIGTVLRNEGHEVTVYNENMGKVDYSEVAESDVVGISIMTATAPRGYEIAQVVRSLNRRARVIIGGCHATFMPEEASQYADHVVTGEGEHVIAGLVKYGGDAIVKGRPVEDLDGLPFPDFSLVRGLKRPAITPVSTSRGCPNDCLFCSVSPMFGRRYRLRSAASAIEELSRFKHRHIFFTDDNFAVNKQVTRELLNLMIRRKITPHWTAETSVRIASDEDLLCLMAKANCYRLCIGFESLDPDRLKSYGKKQTPDDIRNCIKALHKHGIKVHGMFISEGYSGVYDRLGLDTLQLTILTPLIGSRLYNAVREAGRFVTQLYPSDWRLFDGTHAVHWPDNMSPLDMQRQTMEALKSFYSRINVLKLLIQGRYNDVRIRYIGHRLIGKWEKQNRDYLDWLSRNLATGPNP